VALLAGGDEEDIHELIDTICHELAHTLYWEHGEEHTEITELFTRIVENTLKIRELDEAV
jgi:predicted SprT family Zn-dependent metalloprotease